MADAWPPKPVPPQDETFRRLWDSRSWEEKTIAKLNEAKEQSQKANEELQYWIAQVEALQQVLELDKRPPIPPQDLTGDTSLWRPFPDAHPPEVVPEKTKEGSDAV